MQNSWSFKVQLFALYRSLFQVNPSERGTLFNHGTLWCPNVGHRSCSGCCSMELWGPSFILRQHGVDHSPASNRLQWMAFGQDGSWPWRHWPTCGCGGFLHWREGHVQGAEQAGPPLPSSPQCSGSQGWKVCPWDFPTWPFQDPLGTVLPRIWWWCRPSASWGLLRQRRHGRMGWGAAREEARLWPLNWPAVTRARH